MRSRIPPKRHDGSDLFQTPFEAVVPLLPYLPTRSRILEPCCGDGFLAGHLRDMGYIVFGRDIRFGFDFLQHEFECWEVIDIIVTNPPYSMKNQFLRRCYDTGKPFALLLPTTTLDTSARQSLFRKHGIEIILMGGRIQFIPPGSDVSCNWFETAWFTWGLNIGRQLTFAELF